MLLNSEARCFGGFGLRLNLVWVDEHGTGGFFFFALSFSLFLWSIFPSPFPFSLDNLLSLGVFVSLSLYFYSLDQCQPSSPSTQNYLVEFFRMISGSNAGQFKCKSFLHVRTQTYCRSGTVMNSRTLPGRCARGGLWAVRFGSWLSQVGRCFEAATHFPAESS